LLYFTFSYQFFKNGNIGLSGYYVESMETYWRPDTRNINDPSDNRTSLDLIADGKRIGNATDGYLVLNTNIRFHNLFNRDFYAGAQIHNILDTEVRYPTTRSNDVFEKGTIGNGRYITLSFGKKFK
jgi:hypothetical protein